MNVLKYLKLLMSLRQRINSSLTETFKLDTEISKFQISLSHLIVKVLHFTLNRNLDQIWLNKKIYRKVKVTSESLGLPKPYLDVTVVYWSCINRIDSKRPHLWLIALQINKNTTGLSILWQITSTNIPNSLQKMNFLRSHLDNAHQLQKEDRSRGRELHRFEIDVEVGRECSRGRLFPRLAEQPPQLAAK